MRPNHVLVAGAGVSGAGATRLLRALEIPVTVADRDVEAARGLAAGHGAAAADVPGAIACLADFDLVVTSPGWRPDSELLVAARDAGLEVIGDIELAYRLDKAGCFGTPRAWLGVTGTNGKTTTTGMLAAIVLAAGRSGAAVGNIGIAVADALLRRPRIDVLVCELSSFQLHWAPTLRPDAGVLLNLADDHLDWHGSFPAYQASKERIWRGPVAVAGLDDPRVRSLAHGHHTVGFTLDEPGPGQVGVIDGMMVSRLGDDAAPIAPVAGIDPPGPAGVLDALAAGTMALTQGIGAKAIAAGLAGYRVAQHRGQVVETAHERTWIDNSKATNPHAARTALAGLRHIVWVAGGQLKGAGVDELVREVAPRLDGAVLLGEDREILHEALGRIASAVPVRVIDDADARTAMDLACAAAWELSAPGSSIVLAPAAASLDMYQGMAQRGELFARAATASSTGGETK